MAVECALKACIAKNTQKHEFPDKKRAEQSWKHDLRDLVRMAGLRPYLDKEETNTLLKANWTTVSKWDNELRYQHNIQRIDAVDLYRAVTARQNGVLKWIRQSW